MPGLPAAFHVPAGGRGPGLKPTAENAWLISAPALSSSRSRACRHCAGQGWAPAQLGTPLADYQATPITGYERPEAYQGRCPTQAVGGLGA